MNPPLTHTTPSAEIESLQRKLEEAEAARRSTEQRLSAVQSDLIESNRQRVKTVSQIAAEGMELQKVEAERAKRRQGARTDLDNLPTNLPESGESAEHVAESLGISTTQWKKLKTIFQKAQSGDAEARELMKALDAGDISVQPGSFLGATLQKWRLHKVVASAIQTSSGWTAQLCAVGYPFTVRTMSVPYHARKWYRHGCFHADHSLLAGISCNDTSKNTRTMRNKCLHPRYADTAYKAERDCKTKRR